jgi:hypothetical protein
MSGSGYDPKIIERFADQLLRKADTVRVGFAVGGGIFGTFVGAVPMTPLKSVWGVPAGFGVATIIVGALLGVLIGYVIGEGRAFRYRVQAQSAIFQLEIERRVTSAVAEAVSQAAVTPVHPAGEPQPAAEAQPVAPARPAVAPMPPPLTPVEAPTAPLLRPPGMPSPAAEESSDEASEPDVQDVPPVSPAPEELPPVSPATDELPPLSPAANG